MVHLHFLLGLVDRQDFQEVVRWLLAILRKNGLMRSLLDPVLSGFKEANYLINPSYIIGGKAFYLFNILKSQRSIVYAIDQMPKNISNTKETLIL
jgi:hypothetical protein